MELTAKGQQPSANEITSPDGRFHLTADALTVDGATYGLRELERAEVRHVRWLLWYLLGSLGLGGVLIEFLQNHLSTLAAMGGLVLSAGLLLLGQRGTNRLRLWRLGRLPAHVALPGALPPWQALVSELNRRIARAHDAAAQETATLLAALAEAELVESARPAGAAGNTAPARPGPAPASSV